MKDKVEHYIVEEKDYGKAFCFFLLHFFGFGIFLGGITVLFAIFILNDIGVDDDLVLIFSTCIWWIFYLSILYSHREDFKPEIIKKVEHRIV